MSAATIHSAEPRGTALPRTIGIHGRTLVLFGMGGGVALGGVLVAAMTMSGRLSGHALFMNATVLFVAGAVLGLLHGAVLGYLGRPFGTSPRAALRDLALAGLYAVPGLAIAWLAAVWVAMTLIAGYTGRIGARIGSGLGWIASATILASAGVHAWRALRNAYARWQERQVGTLVVAGSFAALLVTFLADRPEIWGTHVRFTETGAVLLAAALAVWVAGPLVTVALGLLRQLPNVGARRSVVAKRWTPADLLVGLLAGATVGLLTAPFAAPGAPPAAAGTVVVAVGHALLDEVLLRLGLVTAVAWVLLRWGKVGQTGAAVGAVLIAAAFQVALYTPGAVSVGFPTAGSTIGFLAAAVAVPALVFGGLFWKRGFVTALVADATALIALLFLA